LGPPLSRAATPCAARGNSAYFLLATSQRSFAPGDEKLPFPRKKRRQPYQSERVPAVLAAPRGSLDYGA
jgi:hypothetical protein